MASEEYKLRCEILGHSKDVRAVATTAEGFIITASRDNTAKLWTPLPDGRCYKEVQVYQGHNSYVTSVCVCVGEKEYPDGLVATGSRDTTILVYPVNATQPLHTLTGHSDTVSCLGWSEGILVSGSWDCTGRVWTNWQCTQELKGHEGPLWAVALVPGQPTTTVLTASADKTIKLWKNGKECQTYSGHKDCVRGLAVLSADRFMSCSNDATVILWTTVGQALSTYYSHTNFIYGIALIGSEGVFATGGEDRTLRVWSAAGECIQTIHLPAQSVWSVAGLPNSDIVCGSSDGMCRVFSRVKDRQADLDTQKEFEESIAKSTMAVGDLGGIKKSELPGKEVLFAPGKRDGQTVIVREGDKINCYSWSASKQEWSSVGEVVGGAGGSNSTSGKVLFEGKEYDFVFDVELDQGQFLKLPYNAYEDPYYAAQRFIHKHELPQAFLDKVATFIIENTKGMTLGIESGQFTDPFTGGSRYMPGSSSGVGATGGDPFTGNGCYIPGTSEENLSARGTSHITHTAINVPCVSPFFPQHTPLRFGACNSAGMLSKLTESNSAQVPANQLSSENLSLIIKCVTEPEEADPGLLGSLESALQQWSTEHVWPALDVLRLALLSEKMQNVWLNADRRGPLVSHLMSLLQPPSNPTVHLMIFRCLANMATYQPGRKALTEMWEKVITAIVELSPYKSKNIEIAAATVLLNYTVIFGTEDTFEKKCQVLSGAGAVAMSSTDPEAQFRCLVALGTLLQSCAKCRSLAASLDLKPVVQALVSITDPIKVGECASHILKLL